MFLVMLEPWAMSEPHMHGPGTEEIWVKLSPGTAVMLLGSELREMPQYSAYLVPPTGVTQHANLNLDRTRRESFLYIARGPTPPELADAGPVQAPTPAEGAAAAPGRGRGGGRGNPNLFGDQATTELADVAGTPLP
jgi:hypothetical protein